ncbi:MAG: PQQ-binding-like beta-propeller repeat protein [Myxococcales bacterium]|nr:PQQ-binding-like beta-propeller repeat protein [Myxococcales bacterium]
MTRRHRFLLALACLALAGCDCGSRTRRRTPPALSLESNLVDFGRVAVLTRATKTVVLENTGEDPLKLFGLPIEQEVRVFSTSVLSGEIPGGSKLRLELAFEPFQAASYQGRLVIESDSSTARVFVVELRGEGVSCCDGGVDAGSDAGQDAGADAGADAGSDAGTDGGIDAGWRDGGSCVGAPEGTVKWTYPPSGSAGGAIFSSPALGADGTLYFGTSDGRLLALWPDGTLRWAFNTQSGQLVASSPAIDSAGNVYFGCYDEKLYSVDPAGNLRWAFTTAGDVNSSPAIGEDGAIYVGSGDGRLYAVEPSGTQRWAYNAGAYIYSSPAIGPEGVVYVGTKSPGSVLAINPNGTLRWSYSIGTDVDSSPAISLDGRIYVGADDGVLYALDSTGGLKFAYAAGGGGSGGIDSSPAIAPDGTAYVGSWGDFVDAVDSFGKQKWRFPTLSTVGWSSPTIGANGTIFIGTKDAHSASQPNRLLALEPDGGLRFSMTTSTIEFIDTSPALAPDGTLYFGTWGGKMYALCTESLGLAKTTWPRFRHDSRNTGRLPRCSIDISVQCNPAPTSWPATYTIVVNDADPGRLSFGDPDNPSLVNFCVTGVGPLNVSAKSGLITASFNMGACQARAYPASNTCSTAKSYSCP